MPDERMDAIKKRVKIPQQSSTVKDNQTIFSDNLFNSLEKHPRAMNEKETTSKLHIHGNVERRNFV